MTFIVKFCLFIFLCVTALTGCASIPQTQLDAILKDLQSCHRQYMLQLGGTSVGDNFSASITCDPVVAPNSVLQTTTTTVVPPGKP